jgi:glycosyltransferase involved in cell wall biosynthesis
MTRALVIEGSGNLWGSERALLDLLSCMPALEIAVCCPPDRPLSGELANQRILTLPYHVYNLHKKTRWHRLGAAIGVLRACLEFRPHVIYLNQSGSYKVVLPAATLLNLPMVAHIRLFEDACYLARQIPSPRRLRGIIAISSAVEAEICRFQELEAIPRHRIYDAYVPSLRPLAPYSTPRTANRVACVGRLEPGKGQDLLVRAIALLSTVGASVECLMVGDGEGCFAEELKRMASTGSAASSIQWLGFVSDVHSRLRTCSVLACPSHREALGRIIFDAWDAGAIPVVFAGSGGAAEIITAAEGGILYNEQTPQSLAMALRKALEFEGERRDELVRNGRMWMSTNCNPEAYGKTISTILSNAASSSYTLDGLR